MGKVKKLKSKKIKFLEYKPKKYCFQYRIIQGIKLA